MRRVGRYDQVGHLALSASELLSGGASNAWPLRCWGLRVCARLVFP